MFNILDSGAPNILRAQASGHLTANDHNEFRARLDALVRRFGKIRVILDVVDLNGFDPCSAWDDPVSNLRWKDAVKRFAIIGEAGDLDWEKCLAQPFVNVKLFSPEEREEAWHWVADGAEEEIDQEWIRHLAYAKWEAAGRPVGDGLPFWVEAEKELLHTS